MEASSPLHRVNGNIPYADEIPEEGEDMSPVVSCQTVKGFSLLHRVKGSISYADEIPDVEEDMSPAVNCE